MSPPCARGRHWSGRAAVRMWRGSRCARASRHAARSAWLPQARIPPGRGQPEIRVGTRRGDPSPRRAVEKAGLNEERLVDVLDGVFLLVDGGGQAVDAHGPAAELVDDRPQQLAIELVEAE